MVSITNFYQQALDYLAIIAGNGEAGGGGEGTSQETIEAAIEAADLHPSEEHIESQLNAPNTSTPERIFDGYQDLFVTFAASNIGTSISVRLEGKATPTSVWTNLDPSGDWVIAVSNNYSFTYSGTLYSVRFTFVSETGGTGTTIDVALRFAK